jgi:ABC-type branched-subunit amino acid transport system substrate-binding protein
MRWSPRQSLTVTGVLMVALATAGCGSDSEGNGGGGGGSASKLTGDPIKLGVTVADGTASQNNPDVVAAQRAAADAINAEGGVDGRPFEIVFCNEGADPNTATACGRQMAAEKVVATIRDQSITGGAQLNSVMLAAKIPQVYLSTLVASEFNSENVFPFDGGTVMQYVGAEKALLDKGGKKVAILGDDLPFSDTIESTVKKGAEELGLEYGGYAKVTLSTTDYLPAATQIVKSGADGVILQLTGTQILQVVPALETAGYDGWLLANGGGLKGPDYPKFGDAGSRLLVFQQVPPISAADKFPVIAQMRKDLQARKDGGDQDVDMLPNASTIAGYLGVRAIAKLAATIPDITNQKLLDALNGGTPLDNGLTPPIDYSKSGPVDGFSRVPASWGYSLTVKDGQLVLASDEPFNVITLLE